MTEQGRPAADTATDNNPSASAPAGGRAQTLAEKYRRGLPLGRPFGWLRAGARDFAVTPGSSIAYGLAVFALSIGFIAALFEFGFSYIVLPSVAGFMVVGPLIAVGLYEKSRLIERGARTVPLAAMLRGKIQSRGELLVLGVILLLVMLFWLRTAILLYALFYGLKPAGGFMETLEALFFTQRGLTLLGVGTGVGGLMAAFAFSVSAISIPMLMHEKKDTITAMTISLVTAWHNAPVAAVWAGLVIGLFLLCVATGFLGLVVIFPILGHATWHAYRDLRGDALIVASHQAAEAGTAS